jgi:hypothetical protein
VLIMDALFVFPFLLLAIVIAFLLADKVGQGIFTAAIAITVVYVPLYFRVVRSRSGGVVRGGGARARGEAVRSSAVPSSTFRTFPTGDPQRCRRDPNARGARLPRLWNPAYRGRGVGLRHPARGLGRRVGHLVDGLFPGPRHRAPRHRAHAARRGAERDDQSRARKRSITKVELPPAEEARSPDASSPCATSVYCGRPRRRARRRRRLPTRRGEVVVRRRVGLRRRRSAAASRLAEARCRTGGAYGANRRPTSKELRRRGPTSA